MRYTRKLGEYAASLKFEDLPSEVIEQVKLITLHTIAVSIASTDVETTKLAFELTKHKGGVKEASIWGSEDLKVPIDEAAFANGTAADVMDWEDCTWTGHASAGAIPAAFAVSEWLGRNGKEYIEAVVAAYEVYQRIAMGVQPNEEQGKLIGSGKVRDWGLVNWQIFSSGVAAGKLMKMDSEQMAACISKNAYLTPLATGLIDCSDVYHFAHGVSARSGVHTALLTLKGARSEYFLDALDGPNGYWRQVADGVDWTWFDRNLGEVYYIMETLLKHWPVNIWVQGPLDALHNLVTMHNFKSEEIKKIRVSPYNNIFLKEAARPYRFMQAQYNLPHCFAAYLHENNPTSDWFSPENCAIDSPLLTTVEKIEFFGPEMHYFDAFLLFMEGSFPEVTVEVELKNGTLLKETLRYPKGHPKNQFNFEEESDFFLKRVEPYIGRENANKFIKEIKNLENCQNIADLAPLLFLKKQDA